MDETTSLLSGSSKSGDNKDHGATRRSRLSSFSRFGTNVDTAGVKPSGATICTIPKELTTDAFPRQRKSVVGAKVGGEGGGPQTHQRGARSFMQVADGSISALTPVEIGRKTLYEELPFVAIPGLQKKERALSVAFASFAAALDTQEIDEHRASTTGKGMNKEEKEKRLSRMSVMMLDELEVDAVTKVTLPLIFAVLIVSSLVFMAGYNVSVMNAPEPFVFPGHSTSSWSIAVAAFCVGGPVGAVLGGKWADQSGRKGALILVAWLYVIGGLIQSLAPSMSVIVVARMVIGVAAGATSVLVPIYLGELAPPNLRGLFGTIAQFGLVTGILFADIVGFPLANANHWRYMFGLTTALGLLPLILKPYLLESPRWLLGRNPNSEEARSVIKALRGFRYDEEVETEVDHFLGASKMQSMDTDADTNCGKDGEPSKGHASKTKSATAEMFADKKIRLLVVSTLVLQLSCQLCGINAVFFYSGLFFEGTIDNPLVGTTLIGAINVLATYVALFLMDKCGRRTLIMWSSAGMFVSCVVIVLSLLGYFSKMVALVAVASYVSFFEIGLGPIPALIVAEMFESKYVTAAMSVSSQVNWTCSFFVGLFFPYLNKSLGPYSFAPFAVVLLLTFIYAWVWLPETQGTTPAELQAELVRKNAGVTYHNMDIEGMASALPRSQDEWAAAMAELACDEDCERHTL